MAVHSLAAVQAISVIFQVGYNLGESDFMSVLLACAIRICQSLNLHRLGADPENPSLDLCLLSAQEQSIMRKAAIFREVKKRVWWMMIRQDWLQIPFGNLFSISASHFNTPMPINCYDEPNSMTLNGNILPQDLHVYTQTSYSAIHNLSKRSATQVVGDDS